MQLHEETLQLTHVDTHSVICRYLTVACKHFVYTDFPLTNHLIVSNVISKSIKYRKRKETVVMVYKILNNLGPGYLISLFEKRRGGTSRTLRSTGTNHDCYTPLLRTLIKNFCGAKAFLVP